MWKLLDGRDWLWGNLGLALMAGAMLNKSLIQFSVDEWGCVPSCSGLRPNYGRGNDDLPKGLSQDCCNQCPQPHGSHSQLTSLPETPRHLQASLPQSLVGSLLLSPGSGCAQDFVCALRQSVSPVLWKFITKSHWAPISLGVLSPFAGFPGWEICCGALELLQQYENSFGIAVSSLWVVCSVALWWGLQVMPPRSVAARAAVSMAAHC